MLRIQRMNDCNNADGCINDIPQTTVYANNKLVAVNGSKGTSHTPCELPDIIHCAGNWVTANGNETVFIEGIPVNREGDIDSCGHVRIDGSSNVFVG